MTASNLSIVMAPNLIFDHSKTSLSGGGDFSESSVINEIVESLINDFDYYFGDLGNIQLLKDPPCLIGRRNSGFRNSQLLQQHPPPKPARPLLSSEEVTNELNTSSVVDPSLTGQIEERQHLSAPPRPVTPSLATPTRPIPKQRTPVPKPRNSRNKMTPPPPPRPSDRPSVDRRVGTPTISPPVNKSSENSVAVNSNQTKL